MLEDVLTAVEACTAIDRILVVTDDEDVTALAGAFGAEIRAEPDSPGLIEAVTEAGVALAGEGADAMVFLPGDTSGTGCGHHRYHAKRWRQFSHCTGGGSGWIKLCGLLTAGLHDVRFRHRQFQKAPRYRQAAGYGTPGREAAGSWPRY